MGTLLLPPNGTLSNRISKNKNAALLAYIMKSLNASFGINRKPLIEQHTPFDEDLPYLFNDFLLECPKIPENICVLFRIILPCTCHVDKKAEPNEEQNGTN